MKFMKISIEKQTISKERISNFGEVYTSEKEVNNMLDLVQQETERFDSRFLEPACGNGNFLIEVLKRKLKYLKTNYKNNQYSFEKFSIITIGSIYGIDILEDNAISTRKRLFEEFCNTYNQLFKNNINSDLINNVKFVISKNIIHGNALNLKKVNSNEYIIFSEWSLINDQIKRRDFQFKNLIEYAPFEKGSLFSDLGEDVFLPSPIKEYPLTHHLKIVETY